MLYQCADIILVDPASYTAPTGQNGCFTGALEVATVDTNDYSDSTGGDGLSGVSRMVLGLSRLAVH